MNSQISTGDRIISVLTYFTGGSAGFIFLIVFLILKKMPSKFLLFNIYQSIFISFGLFILSILYNLAMDLFIRIPFIKILANYINLAISAPVFYGLSIAGLILFIVYLYMSVFSLMGRYAYVPWVSKIILYQIDR